MTVSKRVVRESIIDAARYIIGRYGLRNTTMDAIARGTRKRKSSVYYYFKNKEEIFTAVVAKEVDGVKKELINALASEGDPKEKLMVYVLTRMRIVNRLGKFYSTFQDDYYGSFDFVQRIREEYDRYETRIIRDILQEGVSKGVFTVANPGMAASAILVALKGFEYQWAAARDLERLEKNMEQLMGLLYNGIIKR